MARSQKPEDIDSNISQFPPDVQAILEKVRATIRRAAPEAKETTSYIVKQDAARAAPRRRKRE
jgi:uncharacterized protein YdhG (YjbR/CyaY superfamily)